MFVLMKPRWLPTSCRMASMMRPGMGLAWASIVRASFSQRRKTLVNGLCSAVPLKKDEIEAAIVSCGLDPRVRGETLGLDGFAAVTDAIAERLR